LRTIGLRPSTLACAAILVAYWIPGILAVRWVTWTGEPLLALVRVLGDHYITALRLQPFADHGVFGMALALSGSAVAAWGSIRAGRAGALSGDIWWLAGAMLGLCYLILVLGPLAIGFAYDVLFRFSSCWLIL